MQQQKKQIVTKSLTVTDNIVFHFNGTRYSGKIAAIDTLNKLATVEIKTTVSQLLLVPFDYIISANGYELNEKYEYVGIENVAVDLAVGDTVQLIIKGNTTDTFELSAEIAQIIDGTIRVLVRPSPTTRSATMLKFDKNNTSCYCNNNKATYQLQHIG